MADRFKFAEVRQEVIEMLKKDLLGPSSENEILNQNPRFEYIVGMLAPQTSENDSNEQEVDGDASFEGDADYTAGEDDDNEPVFTNRFKTPSSIGISFYLESSTKSFNVDVTWGDYTKASDKTTNKEGKKVDVSTYTRHPQKETVVIDLQEFSKNKEYPLVCDSNVILYISKIGLKQGYTLVTTYVINKRKNPESDIAGMMFQVNLRAYSQDKMDIFVAEHICRKILAVDEFYFAQRPILGRGRGCAATWKANKNGRASEIVSTFIPEYEFPGVSAALEGFDPFFFSMRTLSVAKKKDDIINRLNVLADSYENWIQKKLVHDSKMDDAKFKKEIGDTVINKCIEALGRIRAGIQLLVEDDISFDAFCFMNRSMILQRNIMNFSKKHGAGIECAFRDFVDPRNPSNNFGWRPFQIAFILMNLKGIVDPEHDNREVVDLLYFPTGGGKTEAYLGLMAFVIANRRLRTNESDEYNRDGGVTAILRYTLRLLTTQQRDRITKMILAAELIRQKEYPKYGKEPISIGFWVGGTVTPNTFKELEEDPEDPAKTRTARSKKDSIYKQLLTCPFCGKPLTEENFYIDIPTKSVSIYCSDDKCMFYRYKPSNKMKIPVYLVDEEIYAKCPTIILSTVDKFARLPWDVNTNALFGRVDRICSRDGYVAIGADHARHTRTEELPTATLRSIKPFLPPELIIQDELHLITGPLGTVYGAYETVIEDLCSYTIGGKKIKPKYVVSTATIKNAAEQTKCLYGRKVTAQFPPNGFEIGDSFYIREVPVEQDPFRRYVGVCAPGQSVKTALLRVYSIILQSAYNLSLDDEYKDVIDPYYTLVGYYNSIRELGGAVRLLQDDIPDRIQRIKKKYGMSRQRFLNHKVEITSRMSSYDMFDNNKLGEIRPNQLITTFGPGSIVDAVKDSVTVLDLNYWKEKGKKIIDGRLASYLGVDCFYMPRTSYSGDIPVVSFPYMHVCSNVKCGRIFDLRENFDLDRYLKFGVTCPECHRQAYPSRFITICENGHMDDFPWSWWVHGGNTTCKGTMRMYSTGNTSTLADMWVECSCGARRSMSGATQHENFEGMKCSGHHPFRPNHKNEKCDKEMIPSQRGASNVYFPVMRSAISIPPWINPLYNLIDEHLRLIDSYEEDFGEMGLDKVYQKYFSVFTREEFDAALLRRRQNIKEFTEIKQMEYNAITHHADPVYASNKKHFKAEEDPLPDYLLPYFKRVIRITRLREVRVLLGFTRVDAPDPDADEQTNIVYLNKGKTEKWLPAAEVHGEGVFIEFNRDSIDAWLRDPELGALSQKYAQCYKEFCESKEWTVTTLRDARYVLMHTFAHLLIKQMSMSSGYSSSAIRERVYFGDDMSGVLLYTGSADKEGSLGGLVELGNIDQLIVLMKDAFQEALVCTNDPECLNNVPAGNNSNGAACHSCCMISETACENGNRMLDRGLIVPIDGRENQSYFKTLVEELCQLEV